jgi:hypothetical protein
VRVRVCGRSDRGGVIWVLLRGLFFLIRSELIGDVEKSSLISFKEKSIC